MSAHDPERHPGSAQSVEDLARRLFIVVASLAFLSETATAQVTTTSGDTPAIRVGVTFFGDYTYTKEPTAKDADGNDIHNSSFNVARTYINVTGNISHLIAFRITPDVVRTASDSGSALGGSLVFRVKFAYAQFNLGDWLPRSYARFGVQPNTWSDFVDGIYRYRFQGPTFAEREGYFTSSDAGVSFHYDLPSNYGDAHVSFFNGENYNRAEVNDQKALMVRASLRPFAQQTSILRGVRASVFYDDDHYVRNAERTRLLGGLFFEHPYVTTGFEYLDAHDQPSITSNNVHGKGYAIWAIPRSSKGWEALLRFDHLVPNTAIDTQARNRTIMGIAYWFPVQGTVTAALLLDYDGLTVEHFEPAQPAQRRIALHALINY